MASIVVPKRQLKPIRFNSRYIQNRAKNAPKDRFFAAMSEFIKGNQRYQVRRKARRNWPVETLSNLKGQNPTFVRILCSDSRQPEENTDMPSGKQFMIETAGNNLGKAENNRNAYASVEYALHFSNLAVIEVERHDDCGAVKAVLQYGIGDVEQHGPNMAALIDSLSPALVESGGELKRAIYINGVLAIENLYSQSQKIKKHVDEGKVTLVGAHYHHDTRAIDQIEAFVPGHLIGRY